MGGWFNFGMGGVGGAAGARTAWTGPPSVAGAAGTLAGMGARQMYDRSAVMQRTFGPAARARRYGHSRPLYTGAKARQRVYSRHHS